LIASVCSTNHLEAHATVLAADGRSVDLELAPARSCEGCKGLCLWSLQRRPSRLSVSPNQTIGGLMPGDELILRVPSAAVLRAALIAYGLPLLSLLTGAATLGAGGDDRGAVLGAVLGLALGVPLGRRLQRKLVSRLAIQLSLPPREES